MSTATEKLLILGGPATCALVLNHMILRLSKMPKSITADDLESLSNQLGRMAHQKRRDEDEHN